MQQAINWADVDLDLYRQMASLGHNELMHKSQHANWWAVSCHFWMNHSMLTDVQFHTSNALTPVGYEMGSVMPLMNEPNMLKDGQCHTINAFVNLRKLTD